MAITARAEGTWFSAAATGSAGVAIPGSPVAGDMMFVLASWKDFSLTATCNQGFTEITEYADGAVAAGNGVGSMKVAAWYKEHTGSESQPDVTFSGTQDIASVVMIIFQKGAGETWDAPAFTTGNITTGTFTVTCAANPGITAGDLCIALCGVRDDSALFTRGATTAIAATGITWAADYVEYPATHATTTSGGDMSADAGYRIAGSGTASAAPTVQGTLSATETGAILFIRQRVTAAAVERVPKSSPYPQLLAH